MPANPNPALPFITHGGHNRVMGCIIPPRGKFNHLPTYEDYLAQQGKGLIPRSDWVEFEEDDSFLPILDQDGHGSCVGHGSVTAFTAAWFQAGNKPQRFSPNYLYSLINGGSDNGAMVGDAMDALMKDGVCLESTVPEGDVIYTRQMPPAAKTEAARFKLGQAFRVATFDGIVTAALNREAISIGVNWPSNGNTNAAGELPDPRGSVGGHCLCLRLGLKNFNGKWKVKGQNSWNTSWGLAGKFYMGEAWFAHDTDHFISIAPLLDPIDPDVPPKPTV